MRPNVGCGRFSRRGLPFFLTFSGVVMSGGVRERWLCLRVAGAVSPAYVGVSRDGAVVVVKRRARALRWPASSRSLAEFVLRRCGTAVKCELEEFDRWR